MRERVQQGLDSLRRQNGLYLASPSNTYHYIWIRDNCYISLSKLGKDDSEYEQIYHRILDIWRKYEWKLAFHADHQPEAVYQYIHPRYTADTLEEIHEPWGNAQNDAIGIFLYGLGLGLRHHRRMLRDDVDVRIVRLLIRYLKTLAFWCNADNGMWEEEVELHASSIGACVAGLLAIKPFFEIEIDMIRDGMIALWRILPHESATHDCDLAQLSLVYPYRLLPGDMASEIVRRVEQNLLRDRGVIRYAGDRYYADSGREAEWCMGLPWLGLCHATLGNQDEARRYLEWTERVMTPDVRIPELYLSAQGVPNENTPLGWAHALYLILHDLLR
ncbi:phosphorylase kinase alpha/beta subunit [Alicyclobacillus sacchari]|uniref:Phosphorylase kinase alpha/beta subunit n=1 Tax=Alicyclobacillus sacchari TaxID=392010 RepID=A0A4R8LIE9_9BACL|nr:glycoside hydrolase family 15 protein [Alicyclobacillus sacchari]TDY43079.1 phosphorylase kinase alpha/beta subunit [Alicyclobacillus sacchari]GMA57822.1 hypothetical protein GCM10025858_23250 [Alicyclobacillus sacchari]